MNEFLLLAPFFLIRFGFLALLRKQAVRRAAHFAPVQGKEVTAYWIYQISTAGIMLCPLFLHINADFSILFYAGLLFSVIGLAALFITIIHFSFPDDRGLNTNGLYRVSRNPMYVSYFFCFAGMALLTQSAVLFCLVVIFQIAAHWIIRAEERECIKKFGMAYEQYMEKTRRYL